MEIMYAVTHSNTQVSEAHWWTSLNARGVMYADATSSHMMCQLSTGQEGRNVLSLILLSVHSTVFIGIHVPLDLCSRLPVEVGKSL